MRDRLRRRRPAATRRGRRHRPTSPSTTGPIADADAASRSPRASTWRPRPSRQRAAVDGPLGPGPRHAACRCSILVLLARGAERSPSARSWRAKSREKPPGLPGALRAAGGDRPRAGEVHLQRDRRPRDVRRHAHVRRGEGGHRPHPRPGRHLDDHGQATGRRAGPGSTRSPSASRTSSAARAPRSPPKEGRAAGLAAQGGDRAVRQQRRDLGARRRATWSAAGLGGLGGLLVLAGFAPVLVRIAIWNPFSMT